MKLFTSQLTFFVLLSFISIKLSAQTNFLGVMDFLPPPPNAAAITEYGLESLKNNTGATNVDIPLINTKGHHLAVSVGIGYNSGGIRVDQIASRVGMGWALKAGGVITRTVLGKVDERSIREYPPQIQIDWHTVAWSLRNLYPSSTREAQSDIYSCEFDGYAGNWVNDGAGHLLEVNQTGIKIEGYHSCSDWNFKVTDLNGIEYYFGGNTATETTKRTTDCGKYKDEPIETAWYLSKIKDPNTGESITFIYTPLNYSYDNGINESQLIIHNLSCSNWPADKCVNKVTVSGWLLSRILTNGMNIDFSYTDREDCNDKLVSKIRTSWFNHTTHENTAGSFWAFEYETVTSNNFLNEYSTLPPVLVFLCASRCRSYDRTPKPGKIDLLSLPVLSSENVGKPVQSSKRKLPKLVLAIIVKPGRGVLVFFRVFT